MKCKVTLYFYIDSNMMNIYFLNVFILHFVCNILITFHKAVILNLYILYVYMYVLNSILCHTYQIIYTTCYIHRGLH